MANRFIKTAGGFEREQTKDLFAFIDPEKDAHVVVFEVGKNGYCCSVELGGNELHSPR